MIKSLKNLFNFNQLIKSEKEDDTMEHLQKILLIRKTLGTDTPFWYVENGHPITKHSMKKFKKYVCFVSDKKQISYSEYIVEFSEMFKVDLEQILIENIYFNEEEAHTVYDKSRKKDNQSHQEN